MSEDPIPFTDSDNVLEVVLTIYNTRIQGTTVSCMWLPSAGRAVFHSFFLPFIALLNSLNEEISVLNFEKMKTQDACYWLSYRKYLNSVLLNTLENFQKHEEPVAFAHWLCREFFMKKHDENGRKEYRSLMENQGIKPYIMDPFKLCMIIPSDLDLNLF